MQGVPSNEQIQARPFEEEKLLSLHFLNSPSSTHNSHNSHSFHNCSPTPIHASPKSIMVKFCESNYAYEYSFPAVTLAYFLRYPNPYAHHVLSTDTISRSIDSNGRLHTLRIHRKSSRLPPAVLKLLPKSVLGNVRGGTSESYILETSTIDVKEGWMRTESKNLDWTGVLSVVERQEYQRQPPMEEGDDFSVGAGTTGTAIQASRRRSMTPTC